MYRLYLKKDYHSDLDARETERAITLIKKVFEQNFSLALNLERVSAPLFVTKKSGLNDDLNGVERKVEFDFKEMDEPCEIVQSLAKWKRFALYNYGYQEGEGIYTDMNAVRRDDSLDNTHSAYVDQWDWEKVITKNQRTPEFLKETVQKIVDAIATTHDEIRKKYPSLKNKTERKVFFTTTQELENLYPSLSSKEREDAITKEYKTVFLMNIGGKLTSGKKHDGRAPDYDDWQLNGDILVWNDVLNASLELSSMGIRVDSFSLLSQLEAANALERKNFDYHKKIIDNVLPLTIGGGIGQSRLCMHLLEKLHVGEVQASVWPEAMVKELNKANIKLL